MSGNLYCGETDTDGLKKVTLDEIRAMHLLGIGDYEILIWNMEANGWFFVYQNERGRFISPQSPIIKESK